MAAFTNYYIVLGVSNTASAEEIKAAYRELAKKYHPDKNHGNKAAEEFFKEIQQAYGVLSNPEKRKKFDLKFNYGSTTGQPRKKSAQGPYAGNAYQYAQSTAQQKQYKQPPSAKSSTGKEKTSGKESYQILVSVGIAMVLLYFIISYSTDKKGIPILPATTAETHKKPVPAEPEIGMFDSPYTTYFGKEQSDDASKNYIIVNNSNGAEAVVCLVNADVSGNTIRNYYVTAATTFKMNNIPDGNYFLKVYYGNKWSAQKMMLNGKISGGFEEEIGFVKLNTGKNNFKIEQKKQGTSTSFSSFEITLNAFDTNGVEKITAEEFFK